MDRASLAGPDPATVGLVFFVAPRWGKKQVMVHITICSLTGGLSVSCISGIGSAVILTIRGDMQLKHWFFYFLLAFVVITLLVEINCELRGYGLPRSA
jgi:hypothetical protein